jgi:hypothetical protein
VVDNYIKHPLISYIVVPGCGRWVNKATKIGSEQGLCTTKWDNMIRGGNQTTPKTRMAGKLCCAHGNNLYGYRGRVQIYGVIDTYIQSTYIQITYIVFGDHQNTYIQIHF